MSDGSAADAQWYKDAVIYQVHVKAFADATGDGIGDFDGLTGKLDYLQQLGVTALWLLPFYPSPLRDDGYDIADYDDINPSYGDMAAFRRFLREAHRRDLRVITELVINHTSNEHAWFQRARRAPRGSKERDFYVWSDTPQPYGEARIIFEDFESSNWTWDPVAGQFFWHRFYSHQPDLNFDHPPVHQAVFKAMDRWLGMGVDGVRLDAIPYLYERDGTNCENLPETHAFLKALRARIDTKYPNRMLLAEANQWPEDAVAYLGEGAGDECHMAFHFPLMPRLYMALEMEDSRPIIDILDQTPDIPATSQWAMFLRNHDELTLEMVTDEERVEMRRAYAPDPRMRINLGIRRRLAPLMQNDRRRIELLNVLLFSMPGTPVMYYGDEIGMGDNVYLNDRDGVRTPMQWSPDRNAGFSTTNPQQLYLPVITDPEYHYETVNVESQRANPASLWWWMHDLIAMRRRHPMLGRGSITFIDTDNPKVLAFARHPQPNDPTGAPIVVVANLSRHAQSVNLELSEFAGATPIELFGEQPFAPIEGRYRLTLAAYGYYWLRLDVTETATPPESSRQPLNVEVRGTSIALDHRPTRRAVEQALTRWMPTRAWFEPGGHQLRSTAIIDAVAVGRRDTPATLLIVEALFSQGDRQTYAVPVAVVRAERAGIIAEHDAGRIIGPVPSVGDDALLVDAMAVPSAVAAIARLTSPNATVDTDRGAFCGWRTTAADRLAGTDVVLPGNEQRTTVAVLDKRVAVELRRLLPGGVGVDTELVGALNAAGFDQVVPVRGRVHYRPRRGEAHTVAVVHDAVDHDHDMDAELRQRLRGYFEQVRAKGDMPPTPVELDAELDAETLAALHDIIGPSLDLATVIGELAANLHGALISRGAPSAFTALYQRSLFQSFGGQLRAVCRLAAKDPDTSQAWDDEQVERRLRTVIDTLRGPKLAVVRTAVHGNLHLGRMIWDGRRAVLLDLAGDLHAPTELRQITRSPLRDVASLMVSLDQAADESAVTFADREHQLSRADLEPWVEYWSAGMAAVMWSRYRTRLTQLQPTTAVVPDAPTERRALLQLYQFATLAEQLTNLGASRSGELSGAAQGVADRIRRLVRRLPAGT